MPDSPFDWSKSTDQPATPAANKAQTTAIITTDAKSEVKPAKSQDDLCYRAMASGVSKCVAQTQLRKLADHPDKLKMLVTAQDQHTFGQRWNNLKRWLAEQEKQR